MFGGCIYIYGRKIKQSLEAQHMKFFLLFFAGLTVFFPILLVQNTSFCG